MMLRCPPLDDITPRGIATRRFATHCYAVCWAKRTHFAWRGLNGQIVVDDVAMTKMGPQKHSTQLAVERVPLLPHREET